MLSAPAWGETDEPVASSTPEVSGIAESRSRIQEGKYDEALAILRPLARGREVDAGVLFQIGLAATGASQQPGLAEDQRKALLDEAIGAFRTMLIDRPGLVRVRLELARALFLKGENDLSRRHFEHVLAGNPPAPVLANVRRFLAEIRARRRWTLHTGFALAPDTNIGGTSDERIIHIDIGGQRLPFRRDAEDLTTSGIGVSVWTGGEYQYPLGDGVRLRAGANLSRRDYAGSRFDQTFVSGHAGPRWLVGRNTEASVLASVQRRWSAGAPDYDALGARAEAGHRFTRRVTANAQVSWHDRRYRTRTLLCGGPDGTGGYRTLKADFTEDEITATLINLATLSGDISGNTFSGDEASDISAEHGLDDEGEFTGEFSGGFYGSKAAEAGGVFAFTSEDREAGEFSGAFGAGKD